MSDDDEYKAKAFDEFILDDYNFDTMEDYDLEYLWDYVDTTDFSDLEGGGYQGYESAPSPPKPSPPPPPPPPPPSSTAPSFDPDEDFDDEDYDDFDDDDEGFSFGGGSQQDDDDEESEEEEDEDWTDDSPDDYSADDGFSSDSDYDDDLGSDDFSFLDDLGSYDGLDEPVANIDTSGSSGGTDSWNAKVDKLATDNFDNFLENLDKDPELARDISQSDEWSDKQKALLGTVHKIAKDKTAMSMISEHRAIEKTNEQRAEMMETIRQKTKQMVKHDRENAKNNKYMIADPQKKVWTQDSIHKQKQRVTGIMGLSIGKKTQPKQSLTTKRRHGGHYDRHDQSLYTIYKHVGDDLRYLSQIIEENWQTSLNDMPLERQKDVCLHTVPVITQFWKFLADKYGNRVGKATQRCIEAQPEAFKKILNDMLHHIPDKASADYEGDIVQLLEQLVFLEDYC